MLVAAKQQQSDLQRTAKANKDEESVVIDMDEDEISYEPVTVLQFEEVTVCTFVFFHK